MEWIFSGTNEEKFPIRILIEADDRESAIAKFESDYPQYQYWATEELKR